jgi:hypothetical protein
MYLLCDTEEEDSSNDNGEFGQKDHHWAYSRSSQPAWMRVAVVEDDVMVNGGLQSRAVDS